MQQWSSRVSHAFIVIFHISLAFLFTAGKSRLYCYKAYRIRAYDNKLIFLVLS
jgi:hypothetical protein